MQGGLGSAQVYAGRFIVFFSVALGVFAGTMYAWAATRRDGDEPIGWSSHAAESRTLS